MTAILDFLASTEPGHIVLIGIAALLAMAWVLPQRSDGDL